jgi:hypothetical protein
LSASPRTASRTQSSHRHPYDHVFHRTIPSTWSLCNAVTGGRVRSGNNHFDSEIDNGYVAKTAHAVWNRNRVGYYTHGKAFSGLEGQEVTTDWEQSSLLSVREEERWWRASFVKYLQRKIQDRKVVSNSKLVGYSAKFDSIKRNWNVKIAREVVHGSGKFSKNMILHANLSIISPEESD